MEVLLRLVNATAQQDGAVISLEGLAPELARMFTSPPAYSDNAQALAALKDIELKPSPWIARSM